MTPCDNCTVKLAEHERRLATVERRQQAQSEKLDKIDEKITTLSVENSMRSSANERSMEALRGDVRTLGLQIAEQTGAQKRQSEIEVAKTRRWQRIAVVISIVTGLGAMALSWQEVASYIWVDMLHLNEPWDNVHK